MANKNIKSKKILVTSTSSIVVVDISVCTSSIKIHKKKLLRIRTNKNNLNIIGEKIRLYYYINK